jgi:cytidylate kinase
MKAIRGATTVEKDEAENIKQRVEELLTEIKNANNLNEDNMIFILFSNTADIHSFYPAKAAREAGFFSCVLYSSLEPEIENSLNKCIRVMVLADISTKPKHIYLHNAAALRKDLTTINIAVDGPAGSGKSTVSELIAKRLNILHLDTGATYRAVALACKKYKIDFYDEQQVKANIDKFNIEIKYLNNKQSTMLDNIDISDMIRTPEMSLAASTVSAYKCVRDKMVELQRKFASSNSCILDGRDIGSNVLPNAQFKFFLTASAEIRAKRRMAENQTKNINQPFDIVLADIMLRDKQDSMRKFAPLVCADDAIKIDTSDMGIDEVADKILKIIQEKV